MTPGERFRQIRIIARKELRGFFETPIAYIVAILFVAVAEFLFFRSAFLVGEASLSQLMGFLPWLLLFIAPALTMGTFATERETGTYETLATNPLSEWEIMAGKFLAIVAFLAGLLALVIVPIAFGFSFYGPLDWGVVVGQYLASVFLAALFAALGMFISALFTKQVTALLVSITVNFLLIIIGLDLVAQAMPIVLASLLDSVSALSHFQSMSRGVIDVRDLWYFLSVILAFLALGQYRLLANRFGKRHGTLTRWRTGVLLLVATVLISNVLGAAIPGRVDLTADQLYTLSPATVKMLGSLPDVVNITLYASSRLPSQLQPVLRDTTDLLKDYERYGKGNVVLTVKDPDASPDIATEAQQSGVQPIQFNMVGQGELSVKQGYLGIALAHGGQNRSIPYVEQTGDLEYQLTSDIAELTTTNKKHVAFLSGNGETSRSAGLGTLGTELAKLYTVSDLALSTTTPAIATDTQVIIIAEPTQPFTDAQKSALDAFIGKGGGVLALLSGVAVNQQSLSVAKHAPGIDDLFASYGVTVNPDLVYDLKSNQIVQLPGGSAGQMYLLPYPFWVRAGAVSGSPITAKLQSMLVPWGSSLALDSAALDSAHATATPLIATSPYAGLMTDQFSIEPNADLPHDDLGQRLLAVAVSGVGQPTPRLVVVGNGALLYDQVVKQEAGNLAFGLGAVSWLAQDESLASIKVKSGVVRKLTFGSAIEQAGVEYGSVALGILIPLLIGALVFMKRRRLQKYTYSTRPL